MGVHPAFPEMLSKATWPCLQYFAARGGGHKGDLTDPAPDSTPCDDPTTDPQALEGLILEKSKDQEDAMGGAVQAEQEAEQHSVIMRVAIFTWGIHGGPAQEVTFSLL
uniref:Uncharacterized protein n=1 Tax=Mus musculus TaxID=10090 RepID=Q8CF44_MOUSE|nr:unnamed protein product [Mus musculus]